MAKKNNVIELSNQIGHLIDSYAGVNKVSYSQVIQLLEILKLDYYTEMLEINAIDRECSGCGECDCEDDS